MRHLPIVLAAAALLGNGAVAQQYSTGWNFSWPDTTQQCQNVTIAISGGEPPWIVGLIPIGGSPITWRVRQPENGGNATLQNPVTASIPIQMPAGTRYSVLVTDQIGYAGAGGISVINPTVLQRVGESTDASCLSDVNAIPQEFNFQAYGNAAACGNGFKLAWQDQVGRSPYSMTVVPLDTAYNPWDVPLSGGVIQPDYVWSPNMTAGTYFTLILTNQNGWGRGGVGQVYRVTNGTGPESCVTQPYLGKLAIVGAANIDTALPATASFTTTIAPASAGQTSTSAPNQDAATTSASISTADQPVKTVPPVGGEDSSANGNGGSNGKKQGSSTNVGAIAGGVAGGVVALAAAGLLIWFCLRRKKRNTVDRDGYQYSPPADIDGNNGPLGTGTYMGKVEPFPTQSNKAAGQNRMSIVPEMSYAQHQQPGATLSHAMPVDTPYAPYDNRDSMPMPMPMAFPAPVPSGGRDSYVTPSQTGGSSDQGYEYGSSASGAGLGAAGGLAGTSAAAAGGGTYGGASAGVHGDNPYGTLKAALPPTFTSPRDSYPSNSMTTGAISSDSPPVLAPPIAVPGSSPGSPGSHGPASPPITSSAAAGAGAGGGAGGDSDHRPSSSYMSHGQVNPHQEYNFIRHSDGGAVSPLGGGDGQVGGQVGGGAETVELPPEYDDRRASAQC